jgi:ribonuclease Z
MITLTILGTSSMVPTKDRNPQAFYLEFEGEGLLFDCGEGTQRQMNIAGIPRGRVRRVFISHWHGDHVAGLIGFIQTIGNSGYEGTLSLFGPRGTKERMFHLMNATVFENKVDLAVHELDPQEGEELVAVDTERYRVVCCAMDHGTPCVGYAFVEKDRVRVDMNTCTKLGIKEGPLVGKLSRGQSVVVNGTTVTPEEVTYRVAGKKVAFIPDTQPSPDLALLAQHADVLVCEASFATEHEEKAREFRHMTAAHAAQVASQADVKKLIITHFSQRYMSVDQHVEEARTIFPSTEAAFDLMRITV